jgi:hypothetical protein
MLAHGSRQLQTRFSIQFNKVHKAGSSRHIFEKSIFKSLMCQSSSFNQPESLVTVLPGMKQVLFIEVGFGADQHGQARHFHSS